MRFRIHRGASEIGGNCVEIEAQGRTIIIDLGLPLTAEFASADLLPPIPGLKDGGKDAPLAVILSHSHGDHMGLLGVANPKVPVFMGLHTRVIIEAASPFMRTLTVPGLIRTFADRLTFQVGPFSITPYLTDHSAFDSYGFLVEAEGRRLFYSGDFRGHGRKAKLVTKLLQEPPRPVHTLLLEGTTLSRLPDGSSPLSEHDLENQIREDLLQSRGLVLACFSPQNIDRFVTFYRATRRAGRRFIGDAYLANILRSLNLPSLPVPSAVDLRIYLGIRQKMQIVRQRAFKLIEPLRTTRIYPEEICESPASWVMLFRDSMMADIDRMETLRETRLIYSMWSGYLDRDSSRLMTWCRNKDIPLIHRHTSGHAAPTMLRRFAKALAPEHIVPIHTAVPHLYIEHFESVKLCADGEWHGV